MILDAILFLFHLYFLTRLIYSCIMITANSRSIEVHFKHGLPQLSLRHPIWSKGLLWKSHPFFFPCTFILYYRYLRLLANQSEAPYHFSYYFSDSIILFNNSNNILLQDFSIFQGKKHICHLILNITL